MTQTDAIAPQPVDASQFEAGPRETTGLPRWTVRIVAAIILVLSIVQLRLLERRVHYAG